MRRMVGTLTDSGVLLILHSLQMIIIKTAESFLRIAGLGAGDMLTFIGLASSKPETWR